MNLQNLCHTDVAQQPEAASRECLRGLVVRTNLVPGVRHVLGWRGIKDSSRFTEAWTVRVAGRLGVFGLVFDSAGYEAGWGRGRFNLCYFPHPEEELIENVALEAAVAATHPEYLTGVRDLTANEHLIDLFDIGIIELGIPADGKSVSLTLECLQRQQLTVDDGIEMEGTVLVPPGGLDQDFPAWDVCLDVFRVLAASMSFNLETAPRAQRTWHRPGWVRRLKADQTLEEIITPDNPALRLELAWGEASPPQEPDWQEWTAAQTELADEAWWSSHQVSGFKSVDKNALGIDDRPRLVVVTGFLGSGKTTFLQNFIDHMNRNNRFVAVIQNEIGEVGLDGGLLDHDYAVTELDEGCVCCTLVGQLKPSLRRIMTEFHPDFIMLETTGLANPVNLLTEMAELTELVAFDSVTTLVDAANLPAVLEESEVAKDQIRAADVVLLNKVDLLDEDGLRRAEELVAGLNGNAPIVRTQQGDINPALLYGDDPDQMAALAAERSSGSATHHHEHFHTWKLDLPQALDHPRLIKALDAIPEGVYRLKGIVNVLDRDRPQVVQFVAGRYTVSDHPGQNRNIASGYLILIGKNMDPAPIRALFQGKGTLNLGG